MITTSKNSAGDITCAEGRVSITIPGKVTSARLVEKLRAARADFSGRECDPHDGWIAARSSESRRVERLLRAVLAARGINDPLGEDADEIARLDRIARIAEWNR